MQKFVTKVTLSEVALKEPSRVLCQFCRFFFLGKLTPWTGMHLLVQALQRPSVEGEAYVSHVGPEGVKASVVGAASKVVVVCVESMAFRPLHQVYTSAMTEQLGLAAWLLQHSQTERMPAKNTLTWSRKAKRAEKVSAYQQGCRARARCPASAAHGILGGCT